jgi:hypothetical protein
VRQRGRNHKADRKQQAMAQGGLHGHPVSKLRSNPPTFEKQNAARGKADGVVKPIRFRSA